MKAATDWNRPIALWGVRLILGFLSAHLAMHKIFVGEGLAGQMVWFQELGEWFPTWLLWTTNVYAAVVELIGGLMLVFGIKRDWALWAILSVLVIVTFGHGLEAAVWDIHQMVARVTMIVLLLLLPEDWDLFRLERLGRLKSAFRGS